MSCRLRAAVAALSAVVLTAWAAPGAQASTLAIATTDAVVAQATRVTLSGTAEASGNQVTATVKPAGASGCAPTSGADVGTRIITSPSFDAGSYTIWENHTFAQARDYLVCAWLEGGSGTVAASSTVTVRRPGTSLTVTAPPAVMAGQTFQVGWSWQLEARRSVSVQVVASTGACPANAAAAAQQQVASLTSSMYEIAATPAASAGDVRIDTPGSYLVCGYVHDGSAGGTPELTASAAFVVNAAVQCLVPAVTPGALTLSAVRTMLGAARCGLGEVTQRASNMYKRGRVISLSAGPGTPGAEGAPIDVTVSAGPNCRVPAVPRNRRLGSTRAQLRKANCVVGATRYTRHRRVPSGRVVRLSPRTGLLRNARAKVFAYVSVGRKGCRIPKLSSSRSLRATTSQIRKAGCRVGKVRRVKSSRTKGRVARLSPKPGSLRPVRSKVTVYVSRG